MTSFPRYPGDPGGVFASDVHRRVAAHLPLPDDDGMLAEVLLERIVDDGSTPLGPDDGPALDVVLAELEGDVLTKGVPIIVEGEENRTGYRLTAEGLAKLTGPIANEPAPLAGPRLAAAEALDEEIAAEAVAGEERAKQERVDRAKAELAEAEAELEGNA